MKCKIDLLQAIIHNVHKRKISPKLPAKKDILLYRVKGLMIVAISDRYMIKGTRM